MDVSLPELNSEIEISKGTYHSDDIFVIQKLTEIKGHMVTDPNIEKSPFLQYIRQYHTTPENKLKVCQFVAIEQWLGTLKISFPLMEDNLLQELLFLLFKRFAKCSCKKGDKHPRMVPPHYLRFVAIRSPKYNSLLEWTYGIHKKPERRDFLFAFLEIHETYGFLKLGHETYEFICGYTNKAKVDPRTIVGGYVIVTNYIVITEIFNMKNAVNTESLFFDLNDVERIHQVKFYPTHYTMDSAPRIPYNFITCFRLLRKSTVSLFVMKL